jgi:hypothetical protein
MRKYRDPVKAIDAVIQQLPVERTELRAQLARLKFEIRYVPPESPCPWIGLMNLLRASLNVPPALDWEKKISDIVEGRADIP